MDTQKTLAFLQELSEAALVAARSGDTMLANRLGANLALQHYFNNVHTIPTMRPDVWSQNYPHYMAEADRIRVAHDASEQQQEARMSAIEAQLEKLAEAVAALTPPPAKSPRSKRVVEATPEPDEEPEPDETDGEETEEVPPVEGEPGEEPEPDTDGESEA